VVPGNALIIVFNGMAWGFEHSAFDAAFLAATVQAFPDEPIQLTWTKARSIANR
jgi:hypothetical protein